ncbi:tRNA threonylcarbamoyladenosine dehydratase [Desulfogranum mediterraneum]|uniref:tRNA threonylcarbamoyladenosine dehydratase n=1 Tax=Desulfogranum mediterraneum TaxID=160661 RepID=UPI0003F87F55|nr:tRNA threonylcarbamoyladenosine dehydratase [Desulfogranum mediterraneum]
MERFLRTERLLGPEGFQRLQQAAVTVVGLGAVGGYVVEGLARAGVGRLRLVDFDTIQPSNINRQILALETTLGRAKAQVAAQRVAVINPACRVEALELFADEATMGAILQPAPELLIDAIDSLNPKVQLLSAAHRAGLRVISSMGAALRTDPTKVAWGDIGETWGCPLARRVRKRLRRQGIEEGISCVFSSEAVCFNYRDPEKEAASSGGNPYDGRGRQRRVLGSLPTLTGIFGLTIANQAILELSGGVVREERS